MAKTPKYGVGEQDPTDDSSSYQLQMPDGSWRNMHEVLKERAQQEEEALHRSMDAVHHEATAPRHKPK